MDPQVMEWLKLGAVFFGGGTLLRLYDWANSRGAKLLKEQSDYAESLLRDNQSLITSNQMLRQQNSDLMISEGKMRSDFSRLEHKMELLAEANVGLRSTVDQQSSQIIALTTEVHSLRQTIAATGGA